MSLSANQGTAHLSKCQLPPSNSTSPWKSRIISDDGTQWTLVESQDLAAFEGWLELQQKTNDERGTMNTQPSLQSSRLWLMLGAGFVCAILVAAGIAFTVMRGKGHSSASPTVESTHETAKVASKEDRQKWTIVVAPPFKSETFSIEDQWRRVQAGANNTETRSALGKPSVDGNVIAYRAWEDGSEQIWRVDASKEINIGVEKEWKP